MDFSFPTTTRGGSEALITYQFDSGIKPIHGAYKAGEDWIPCSWTTAGRYDGKRQTALDIIMPVDDPEAA